MIRFALLFWCIGGIWQAPGQSPSAESPVLEATFQRFFAQVVQRENLPAQVQVSINGKLTTLIQTSVQEAMNLTDTESQALFEIASDCENEIHALDLSSRSLVFEARVRLVASDNRDSLARQQLDTQNRQRQKIVAIHMQQLETEFGDLRFKTLMDYLHSREQEFSFFPLAAAKN